MASTPFSPGEAEHTLQQHCGLSRLDGPGRPEHPPEVPAILHRDNALVLDAQTRRYILHHATSRSLMLLYDIGRGTATFDGLSIAWAASEHLAGDLEEEYSPRTITSSMP